jgi:hypothetical protein
VVNSINGGPVRRDVVYVGITGHRPNRIPERHWHRIKKELDMVMAEVEAGHPGRQAVLLSGLAEGADRLAAFVALGRGWKLQAILAFHRTRFEEDFAGSFAHGEFRALLGASTKIEEPKRTAYLRRSREDGYHAVGQRLLALSDILIAVWDGERSRGRGGTVEVIGGARTTGIPVIWVHAKKPIHPKQLKPFEATTNKS